jgi:hypothetical protein
MEDIKLFSISDTLNGKVNSTLLTNEIANSGIITTLKRIDTVFSTDKLNIVFTSGLPQNEFTTLSGVVAAHEGSKLFSDGFKIKIDNTELWTDTTAFSGVLTLKSGKLSAGRYIVTWYSEIAVTDDSNGDASQVRVLINGVVVGVSSNRTEDWQSFSGPARITIVDGQEATITMEVRRAPGPPPGNDIIKIQRKRFFLSKINEIT